MIAAKAPQSDLKVMTADDQLIEPDDKFMTDVPHLGMSPHDIGHQAGELEIAEMECGVILIHIMPAEYLQFQSIGKTFPGVRALDGVTSGVVRAASTH